MGGLEEFVGVAGAGNMHALAQTPRGDRFAGGGNASGQVDDRSGMGGKQQPQRRGGAGKGLLANTFEEIVENVQGDNSAYSRFECRGPDREAPTERDPD